MDILSQIPAVQAYRALKARSLGATPARTMMVRPSMSGLTWKPGGVTVGEGEIAGVLLFSTLLMAINGLCGYVVGKVIAPTDAKVRKYGLIGIPVGALGGLLGIAIFAAVASPR